MAPPYRPPSGSALRGDPVLSRNRRAARWPVWALLIAACVVTASVVLFHQSSTPPPQTFVVAVDSLPRGIDFTIDGVSRTTPFVGPLSATPHTIIMPRHFVVANVTYNFQRWGDGGEDSTKAIHVQADITLSASYAAPVANLTVASDSYVGVLSLSTNGGRKFLADSLGKLIVVYINGLGQIAVAVNNGDPTKDPWLPSFASPRSFVRPAAVLSTDDEMHVLAESGADLVDVVVHFARDAGGSITNASFDPALTVGLGGRYAAVVRAHDGSIWAVWNRQDVSGNVSTASRLIAGHWTAGSGWISQEIALDAENTERFYSVIIERGDNFKLYVFANRGEASIDRRMAFVAAVFSGTGWTWQPPNLVYETIASRGIVDSVDAVWDPIRQLVVVVNDHTGTPSYLVFSLDANDAKTYMNTPRFSIVNNDWGTIFVDPLTADYYLLFMETIVGTVNGRACYTQRSGGVWSDFTVLDQNTLDAAFHARAGGGANRDFIFGRGDSSGSVQILYGRIV